MTPEEEQALLELELQEGDMQELPAPSKANPSLRELLAANEEFKNAQRLQMATELRQRLANASANIDFSPLALQLDEIQGTRGNQEAAKSAYASGLAQDNKITGLRDQLRKEAATDSAMLMKQAVLANKQETDANKLSAKTSIDQKKLDLAEKKLAASTSKEIAKQAEKHAAIDDPKMRLSKLNATSQGAVGSIASGLKAISQMNDAMINKNLGPKHISADTPLIGRMVSDDQYTSGERLLSEVVGRLQSGGAINDEEGKRFVAMGPRPADTKEQRIQKIAAQRSFLANKLKAFGFDTAELAPLGFDTEYVAALPNPGGSLMERIRAAQK